MSDNLPLLLQRALASFGANMRVGMPAKVVSYDASNRLASVQAVLPEVLEDGATLPAPIINGVPVMFAGGAGGALTFPLAVGDEGYAYFADRDISGWAVREAGNDQGQRQHSLTDAVFFPCFTNNSANPLAMELSFGGSSIIMGAEGTITIVPASGTLAVTGNLAVTGSLTAPTASIGGIDFAAHVHPHGSGHGVTGVPE